MKLRNLAFAILVSYFCIVLALWVTFNQTVSKVLVLIIKNMLIDIIVCIIILYPVVYDDP